MNLIEINWTPSHRQLRQFGVICMFALPLLGWIWGASSSVVGPLAAIGGVMALISLVLPQALKPVFLALTIVATPIGILFGEVAMLAIYAGLFLPIGLVFRLMRRDALQLEIDRQASTYWRTKKQPKNAASYYHQS